MSIYDDLYRKGSYNDKENYKLDIVKTWLESIPANSVVDMGCGNGHYIDFLEYEVIGIEPSKFLCNKHGWVNADILSYKGRADALYCMDVLEHIEPLEVDANLQALSKIAPRALLGIANHSDIQKGVELHLIQEDSDWWEKKLNKYYKKVTKTYESPRYFVFEVSNV